MHRWFLFYNGSRRGFLQCTRTLQVIPLPHLDHAIAQCSKKLLYWHFCTFFCPKFHSIYKRGYLILKLYFRANMFCNTKSESCLPKLLPGEICEKNSECLQSLCLEPQRQPQHQPRGHYPPRRSLYILIFSLSLEKRLGSH